MSGKVVAAGLGAAAAVTGVAAAAAAKKPSTGDEADDQATGLDVGVPLEASEAAPVYADRVGDAEYPPDNAFGQPTDPRIP